MLPNSATSSITILMAFVIRILANVPVTVLHRSDLGTDLCAMHKDVDNLMLSWIRIGEYFRHFSFPSDSSYLSDQYALIGGRSCCRWLRIHLGERRFKKFLWCHSTMIIMNSKSSKITNNGPIFHIITEEQEDSFESFTIEQLSSQSSEEKASCGRRCSDQMEIIWPVITPDECPVVAIVPRCEGRDAF